MPFFWVSIHKDIFMKKIYYPYDEFRDDLKMLTQKIDVKFDAILAVARGGLSMAQMLGEFYDIREVYAINTIGYEETQKLETLKVFNIPHLATSSNILIVDDIVDSGDTLKAVLSTLKSRYPDKFFYTASLFYKPTAIIKPDWYVKIADDWIEFFWSEDLR